MLVEHHEYSGAELLLELDQSESGLLCVGRVQRQTASEKFARCTDDQ